MSSLFYNGWAFVEDNLDAPIWITTCPWMIRLGLFQGNYSSLFWQESFLGRKVMVASFHSFAIISARFQEVVIIGVKVLPAAVGEVVSAVKELAKSGDFTVGFAFGCGCGSIFLHFLSGALYDMRQTSLELVTEEKLKDWRRVAKELIDHGFAVVFLLEKIHMVAQMYFGKRAFAEAKAIDTQISYDKEHIAQLEARTSWPSSCLGDPFVGSIIAYEIISSFSCLAWNHIYWSCNYTLV
uniref:Uncharacterized protein n=1 Tax=Fagus sylvatica TaxID=28930 RepID=A0A2N9ESZ5_FAGSY